MSDLPLSDLLYRARCGADWQRIYIHSPDRMPQNEAAIIIGCSTSTYVNWERGTTVPGRKFIPSVANFLNITVKDIAEAIDKHYQIVLKLEPGEFNRHGYKLLRHGRRKHMPKPGDVHNSWTLIRFLRHHNSGHSEWLCRCDCGYEQTLNINSVLCGDSKRCHQCRSKVVSDRFIKPLSTNERFGQWTTIELAGRHDRRIQWLCVCDCGTQRVIDVQSLRSGNSKSCGHAVSKGASNPSAKLTEDDVKNIRASTNLLKETAEQYGVSLTTISAIRLNKTWKHLLP